jgi:hypothetical protein
MEKFFQIIQLCVILDGLVLLVMRNLACINVLTVLASMVHAFVMLDGQESFAIFNLVQMIVMVTELV